ncbi:CDP-alcohol phosphatidyltransferase family protein [Galactobacter caseinivorans]|uniref:CDP-alcohol phosphatidyltransferase family protein n=1 Tax=Galactobacter caseinivorans TaxID=2676123 RepID=A0A496PJM0_9MICC|nr:CDP-alcohol phosphatidyltransferase family protein [Galactobacter caseinivorans]RKW70658.1 CDP-alcohol phosphatidyltransferase family protein [Galactobacter caseinivorans]
MTSGPSGTPSGFESPRPESPRPESPRRESSQTHAERPASGRPASGQPGSGRPRFGEVLAQLGAAQKPGDGVPAYMRWPNRRVARLAAAAAVSVGLSPNAVTWLSVLVSASGLAVLLAAPITWGTGIIVAVLLAAGFALDSADGQVARVTGKGSPAGEWLDHVVDSVRTPAIHLAIAVALAIHHGVEQPWLLVPLLFCLVSTGTFMSQILAEQLRRGLPAPAAAAAPAQEAPQGGSRSLLRSLVLLPVDFGTLCWSLVLWGSPVAFMALYGGLFVINAGYFVLSAARKARGLRVTTGGTA